MLGRAGLILAGLLLAVIAVEVGFRVAGPNVPLDLTMARFQVYHPVYGFFHAPGASGWLRTREFTAYVKFNSRGLRGPEVALPKPAGTYRMLVMGDSVVEAAQVNAEQTMVSLLQDRVRQRAGGRQVEIINAGVAGFGQGQELLFLQRELGAYQPDAIVLVVTIANDLADNSVAVAKRWKLAAERRPFFQVGADGRLQAIPFQPPPEESLGSLRAFARDRSTLFNVLELWWVGKTVARAQGSVIPPLDAEREVYLREPGEDWQQAWSISERLLVELNATAAALNAPLIIILSPAQWQMSSAGWRELVGSGNNAERRFGLEQPGIRLGEIAQRNGLTMLDLLPTFRHASDDDRATLYFKEDGHWNERGHQVAAETIDRFLQSNALPPP